MTAVLTAEIDPPVLVQWRSTLIIASRSSSHSGSVIALVAAGRDDQVRTLGGLALAVGIPGQTMRRYESNNVNRHLDLGQDIENSIVTGPTKS